MIRKVYNLVLDYFDPVAVRKEQLLSSVVSPTYEGAFLTARQQVLKLSPDAKDCVVRLYNSLEVHFQEDLGVKSLDEILKPADIVDNSKQPVDNSKQTMDKPVDYSALTTILENEYAKTASERKALQSIRKRIAATAAETTSDTVDDLNSEQV